MKAVCSGCRSPSCANPSIVVIAAPSRDTASDRHELMRWPSISIVQAPHCPWSHPFLLPVSPSRSRRRSSSVTHGAISKACCVPLIVREIGIVDRAICFTGPSLCYAPRTTIIASCSAVVRAVLVGLEINTMLRSSRFAQRRGVCVLDALSAISRSPGMGGMRRGFIATSSHDNRIGQPRSSSNSGMRTTLPEDRGFCRPARLASVQSQHYSLRQ